MRIKGKDAMFHYGEILTCIVFNTIFLNKKRDAKQIFNIMFWTPEKVFLEPLVRKTLYK